jgi:hypothetical protein
LVIDVSQIVGGLFEEFYVRNSLILVALIVACAGRECSATIAYNTVGSTYTQNFNSLATSNASDDVPFTNDTTITGWHLFTVTSGTDATPVAAGIYDTHTGAATAASYYSFGTPDGDADRALGGIAGNVFYNAGIAAGSADDIPSGNVAGWIAASLTNGTGGTLGSFTLTFNGEQWRRGSSNTTASSMVFEYGIGASFASVSTWNQPGGTFNWTTPRFAAADQNTLNGNVAGAGNTDGRVNGVGGTISNVNWTNGTTLWLRWVELNDTGSDHGVAIDDLSFSAEAVTVPEASPYLFGGAICSLAILWQLRQRRRLAEARI